MADWQREIDNCIDELFEELVEMRRYLHSHPEPSNQEVATAQFISSKLSSHGIEHFKTAKERGVIVNSCKADIPRVALRVDTDALLIRDEKKVDYKSAVDGVMHACGHDAHTAIGLGVCIALHRLEKSFPWPVPWRAIFQPSEEIATGAKEMIAAGALKNVSSIVALHVQPQVEVGEIAIKAGPVCACCEVVDVIVQGRGGHTARPHLTVDPIRAAAAFLSAVYAFDFEALTGQSVVVAFGSISGGANSNVIPDRVCISGSVRGPSEEVISQLNQQLFAIARRTTEEFGAEFDIQFPVLVAPVINDAATTEICRRAAAEVVGPENINQKHLPSLGGEDFGDMLREVPGCMFRLGTASSEATRYPLHSSLFDIDERALAIGSKILARSIVDAAKELS